MSGVTDGGRARHSKQVAATRPIGARRLAGPRRMARAAATLVVLVIAAIAASLFVAPTASAQTLRVQTSRGPYYLGEPIEIQVIASDFAEEPTPEIEPGEPSGGRLRYAGVSDSTSTSISIINGRMSRVKEVHFVYRFEFVADRQGRARIPAFVVSQSNTSRSTRPFDLEIEGVESTGLVGLSLILPEGPIFVGQKVPVEVELTIDVEAQRDLISYQATVPLFDQPNVRFLDESPVGSDTQLEIETGAGTLRLPAVSREQQVGGRRLLVVRARRTMIPLAAEEIAAAAPRVVISRGVRFRRDLFNQRTPTATERLMSEGDPVRLEVIEVPREGRPPSFAGAVGKGFTLEVSADRSVVQLGEPILLSFRLRGDGDLSSASLPPLDAEGLFDPTRFRLPEDPPAGIVDEDGKRFEVAVRVLDADVREIPAIAYTWFDADSRAFETTTSRPIALSVGAAEIIGADAVMRREDTTAELAADERPAVGRESSPGGTTKSTSLQWSGANLAVDDDLDRVLGAEGGSELRLGRLLIPACYGVGLTLLCWAVFDWRRRAVDPREVLRARAFRTAEQSIESAAAAGDEASAELGRALRALVASLPEEADAEFDRLIAACDALRFAPSGSGAALPPELLAAARRFVAERSKRARTREERP